MLSPSPEPFEHGSPVAEAAAGSVAGPSASGQLAALLLLGDGRFPAGGYAHSGGLEPMIACGGVHDVESLEAFLRGRASTAGLVAASFAAAACGALADHDDARLTALDPELDARMPSTAQRTTSRQLGRQLLRVIQTIRPDQRLSDLGATPHQPIVLGGVAATCGLDRHATAMLALHETVAGPAAAAVRLLSLDPFSTHACLVRVGPLLESLARTAVTMSHAELDDLPAASAPLLDLATESHASLDSRLFAS